mmetsp:Transcript_21619/g.43159  ORF Transcript_21619/g.43159 Transcript_21619/m.43159 type:complete len:552 (+) Transcript_21619:38-1693(+)
MEGVKNFCLTWPKRAFLAGCMGLSVLGLITALGEEASDTITQDTWWIGLTICVQVFFMGLAEVKEEWRLRCLMGSFGLFIGAMPAMFVHAGEADEAEEDGLTFAYALSIMGGGFSWIVFAPPPRVSIDALRSHLPEVIISAVCVLGTFILWFDTTSLDLSVLGGTSAFLFLTAVSNDKTPLCTWLSTFFSSWVMLQAFAMMLNSSDSEDDAGLVGALIHFLCNLIFVFWLGVKVMFGPATDEALDKEISSITGDTGGLVGLFAFVCGFIGVCMASADFDESDSYKWYTVAHFAVPLLVLCARQTRGGRRTWLMLWATSWALVTMYVNATMAYFLRKSISEFEAEYETSVAGLCFLMIGVLLAFPALRWLSPVDLLAAIRPNGEKSGLLRTLGFVVACLGTLLGIFSTAAGGFAWCSLCGLVFFASSYTEEMNKIVAWIVLFWNAFWQFTLMNTLRDIEDDDLAIASMFFMWLGFAIIGIAGVFTVEPIAVEGATDTGVPGQPAAGEQATGYPQPGQQGQVATPGAQPTPAYDQGADAVPMGQPVGQPMGSV